ncbi:zona pellucida sperm-binding protein 3-like isoform X2 [Boleophthalmus pectinirostris]|uniref:zona pellucida sperm-binding protein 3-like isoform X2 n=1 Tax=Boleophthalmus pectinirostris TaxID=150288 RepID=UPI002430A5F1|nr:zona pellucida sperm-binding protein 3-like isoform X2 [Boleophthalmus pectinirostris]
MSSMGTLHFVALFGVLLSELYAVPPFISPPKPFKQNALVERPRLTGGQGSKQGHREGADEEREQIKSVTVSCHPDSLEIVIQADLFGVGASVKGSDLRLGVDNDERCKPVLSSNDEYRITAGLLDCGTKHWMTEESLVYTNLLIYSPEPSAGGVIRMEEAVIPIECHYERKYSLTSSALFPTWIPFVSTMATMEKLNFALKVMTPDWLYKRTSNVFYLGEPIPIEASVRPGHHMGLRVFLSSCVATLTPDEHSSPRYVFIEDGCLLDSQVPNSRSQFSSRVQDDKLHLVLDAFRFHNEDRGELYITCQIIAVPVNDADSPNKACTFINGRWRSADGNDYLCGYCQTQNEEGFIQDKLSGSFSPRGLGRVAKPETFWRSGLKTAQERDKEAIVGPLLVLPFEKKMDTKFNVPLYGSSWRSGVPQNTVHV